MSTRSSSVCCGLVRRDALPRTRDELRVFACIACLNVLDGVTRVLGPLLIVLAYTLISLFTYTYFDVIAPAHAWPAAVYAAVTGVGIFLLSGVLFNFTSAVLTSAGDVTSLAAGGRHGGRRHGVAAALAPHGAPHAPAAGGGGDDEDEEDGSDNDDDDLRGAKRGHAEDGVTWTYCRACRKWRPPRAHHCQVCGVCVLKMDHHCVWINRCAGHGNYVFFWRVLAYVVSGCAFMAAVALRPWLRSLEDPAFPPGSEAWRWPGAWALAAPRTRLGLSFALPVALTVAVGGLLAWHVKLLATNQTSIEWHQNRATRTRLRVAGRLWRNAYDLGSWRSNMEAVFGTRSLAAALLAPYPHSAPPPRWAGGGGAVSPLVSRDGTSFPTADTALASGGGGSGGGAGAPRLPPAPHRRIVGTMTAAGAAAAAAASSAGAAAAGSSAAAVTAAAAVTTAFATGSGATRRSAVVGGSGSGSSGWTDAARDAGLDAAEAGDDGERARGERSPLVGVGGHGGVV